MALTSTTAFMDLILPSPTLQLGPLWATELNQALTLVDSHTHVSGQGQQVPTAGININADLAINGFNLTLIRSTRFQIQPGPASVSLGSDVGCLFSAGLGGDLWYNNGSGQQIQLTTGNSINISSAGGITGLTPPALVEYFPTTANGPTFAFFSNVNTPALAGLGASALGLSPNGGVSTVGLLPHSGTFTSFAYTFPSALPSARSFLISDSSGNISYDTSPLVLPASAPSSLSFLTSDTSGNVGYLTETAGITSSMLATSLNFTGIAEVRSQPITINDPGEGNLGIIRGSFDSSGTIISGSGYSVNHSSTGTYIITITTPFLGSAPAGNPSVTANADTGSISPVYVTIQLTTPGSFTLYSYSATSDTLADAAMSFIAVGNR